LIRSDVSVTLTTSSIGRSTGLSGSLSEMRTSSSPI
jgi:hypothetical protein